MGALADDFRFTITTLSEGSSSTHSSMKNFKRLSEILILHSSKLLLQKLIPQFLSKFRPSWSDEIFFARHINVFTLQVRRLV